MAVLPPFRRLAILPPALILLGLVYLPARAEPPKVERDDPVEIIRGIHYQPDPDPAAKRHQLDLYLPRGKKDFPVLVLVHGGAWMIGDRAFFGWGTALGQAFARHGIGVVIPDYRLAPDVKYIGQMQDLARSVAWVYTHIGDYGGDPERMVLCGHSAGGHLVSLLATDPTYLKDVGLKPSIIKGVISVSGVYKVPELTISVSMPAVLEQGITLPGGIRVGGEKDKPKECPSDKPADEGKMTFGFTLFDNVFGKDPKVRKEASPLTHVRPGLPPFLIFYCDSDFPLLPGQAREFAAALKNARDDVKLVEVKDRDHETEMFFACRPEDPVGKMILDFVARCTKN